MKKFMKIAFVAAFAAIAGYGVYANQKVRGSLCAEPAVAQPFALHFEAVHQHLLPGTSRRQCQMQGKRCV